MENYANILQVWGQNNLDGNLNLIYLLNVETHTTETASLFELIVSFLLAPTGALVLMMVYYIS